MINNLTDMSNLLVLNKWKNGNNSLVGWTCNRIIGWPLDRSDSALGRFNRVRPAKILSSRPANTFGFRAGGLGSDERVREVLVKEPPGCCFPHPGSRMERNSSTR